MVSLKKAFYFLRQAKNLTVSRFWFRLSAMLSYSAHWCYKRGCGKQTPVLKEIEEE